jgi:hypothetical protein
MKWEYMRSSLSVSASKDDTPLEEWNHWGKKGWELVSVVEEEHQTFGFFKRAIED